MFAYNQVMKKTIAIVLAVVTLLSGACSPFPPYQSCPVSEHTPISNPYLQRLWSRPGITIYPDRIDTLMQGVTSTVFVFTQQDFEYGGSKILALDTQSGKVLWQRGAVRPASIITSKTQLYTTLYDKIEIIDPSTGNLIKEIRFDKVGNIYYLFATEQNLYAFSQSGRNLAYNFADGTYTLTEPFLGYTSFITEDGILFYSEGGTYKAREVETQSIQWEYPLPEFVKGHPLFTDNMIIIVAETGNIYGLDKKDGTLLWKANTHIISNIAVNKSKLYYLANDGYLKVLDLNTGLEIAKVEFAPTPFQLIDPSAENILIGAYNLWADSDNDILTVSLGDSCQLMGFKINEP